ncbi:DUF7167 family protein [Brevibacillus laterosporus]|uniref:DUF7167 family protein n=1 Tax=Brevibacillus laterosporus TaxID=1465 RepID=UPI0018F87E2E|nr:hypothetical protein [Brevibacillus laterosporus]MBG9776109.1 hypothetical protein [Brevibacillus laterosporus]
MAKFKFSVSTRYVGSERKEIYEIDDEELAGLTEEEQNKVVDEYFNEWLWDNISTSWDRVD